MALKRWVSRQETTIRADVILYNTAIAAFEKMSNWQAGIFKGEKCLAFNERCTSRCFFGELHYLFTSWGGGGQ